MTCKWKVFCEQGDTCVAHDGYDILKCTAFKDKGVPMTNEEYLKSCTTEQLADAIYDLLIDRQWDSWSWKLNGMVLRDIYEHGNTKSTKAIVEWLKQPHGGES